MRRGKCVATAGLVALLAVAGARAALTSPGRIYAPSEAILARAVGGACVLRNCNQTSICQQTGVGSSDYYWYKWTGSMNADTGNVTAECREVKTYFTSTTCNGNGLVNSGLTLSSC